MSLKLAEILIFLTVQKDPDGQSNPPESETFSIWMTVL
jgi:hypothetical protein